MAGFASDSTIHGVNFVFGEHRNSFSRVLWLFLLISSFCGFSFYIYSSYSKYRYSPDIAMRRIERNASEFSMAAITVCPKYYFMPKSMKKSTKNKCEVQAGNFHWCSPYGAEELKKSCKNYEQEIENVNVVNVLNTSAFETYDLLPNHYPYVRAFTHHGICYTVNTQNFDAIFNDEEIHEDFHCYDNADYPKVEWTPERGYFRENVTYPWYIRSMNGYYFFLKLSSNEIENFCFTTSLYIIIHLPNEVPTEFHTMIPVAYGSTSTITLTAKSHRTDDALRAYSADVRKCYFEGERKLRFFNSYTKAHCDLECYRNDTLKACNCVLFWMPRSNSTPICKLSELECIDNIRDYYVKRKITSCSCHPPCNSIDYDVAYYPASTTKDKEEGDNGTLVEVLYMSEIVEEIEDFLTYKVQNFIADIGGLLGLFLGCSLLSLVEILYFVTFGIIKSFRKKEQVENDTPKNNQIDQKLHEEFKNLTLCVKRLEQKMIHLEGQLLIIEEL